MMLKYKCRVGIKSLANERPGLTIEHTNRLHRPLFSCLIRRYEFMNYFYRNTKICKNSKKISHPLLFFEF